MPIMRKIQVFFVRMPILMYGLGRIVQDSITSNKSFVIIPIPVVTSAVVPLQSEFRDLAFGSFTVL